MGKKLDPKKNRVQLQLYITNEQKFYLQKIAETQDRSIASYIRILIAQDIDQSKKNATETEM